NYAAVGIAYDFEARTECAKRGVFSIRQSKSVAGRRRGSRCSSLLRNKIGILVETQCMNHSDRQIVGLEVLRLGFQILNFTQGSDGGLHRKCLGSRRINLKTSGWLILRFHQEHNRSYDEENNGGERTREPPSFDNDS